MIPFSVTDMFIPAGYFLSIFDPEWLLLNGGLLLVFLVVFGQTGLFFCFFLPSGAVMFTTGVLAATGNLPYTIITVCSILILASVSGNSTGYWIGRKAGLLLYRKKDSKFFRQQHLKAAEAFYKKYGWLALTAGLFLPITRTFAPLVAGMVKLDYRRFFLFTWIGSVLWVLSFVMAGYFVGSISFLKDYITYIVIIIIVVVTIPIIIGILKKLRQVRK